MSKYGRSPRTVAGRFKRHRLDCPPRGVHLVPRSPQHVVIPPAVWAAMAPEDRRLRRASRRYTKRHLVELPDVVEVAA